eukprot:scaffold217_cov99-Cylindrotheca_fusiformis.AAC.2
MAFGWIRMDRKADCYARGRKILSLQQLLLPKLSLIRSPNKLLDRGIESTSAFALWGWWQRQILFIGFNVG